MQTQEITAKNKTEWRQWLDTYHLQEKNVWLIIYRKDSGTESITWEEAVEVALCFGWIDSKGIKRDTQSYLQFFSQRSVKSNWSRKNKKTVQKLIEKGLMIEQGLKMVEIAKTNGTWDALNEVEDLIIPSDLQAALAQYPQATQHFETFPPSIRRSILEWILNAKKSETREKRINETARLAQENIRANQYRK